MKRILFALLCLALLAAPAAAAPAPAPDAPLACSGLFFSEYIEGSSNNKALEIFNGTGAAVDLAAGGYKIEMYFNGSSTAGLTINLTGSVASGDVYVVAHASANSAILTQADQTTGTSVNWYNGDDAVVLKQGGTILDVIGQIGTDPGTEWGSGLTSTADNTLRRKSAVSAGDANGLDAFDPSVEWDGFATDTFDGLGAHTASCAGGNAAIVPVCPSSLAAVVGNATSGPVSASDSDGTVVSAAITGGAAAGITLDGVTPAGAVGGTLTGTLNVGASTAAGSYSVVITFANNDAPTPQTATCTVPVTVFDGTCPAATITGISAVQGSGATTPMPGAAVTIRGRVVGDFQGTAGMNGFHVQDSGDGNALTSDGIFVYAPGAIDVVLGDAVQVAGTATEYMGVTELSSVTGVTLCGNPPAISPIDISLPEAADGDLERYEGMLVRLPQTLTVSQNYFQGRDGQVTLSADGRMFLPLNGNGFGDTDELNARRVLILDDGRVGSANENPNPLPYVGADNTLRAGDTVANLTGVIDYGPIDHNTPQTSDYRLQRTQPVSFTRVNARTSEPEAVGGNIKVASFNVLNYFTTWGCANCRGADNATEFDRQRTKIIAAIQAVNADVVGLMEIENNGATAVGDLVSGLNAAMGAGAYAYVAEPAPGSDAIKVAMIYKPGAVTPSGAAQNYQVTTNPTYNPLFDRPPLAQTFSVVSTGEKFTVIVNHFKSKGSCPTSGVDLDYGQGCWNAKRVAQAAGLLNFIAALQASTGDPDVLVIGDLNAYGIEDPINTLVAGGLANQVAKIPAAQRYSYVFDGQSGYLDQGLATAALDAQVNGVTIWHINADEPSVIDYNLDYKPPSPDLYTPTPYRASDHDPVIVGLNLCLSAADPAGLGIARNVSANGVDLTWMASANATGYRVWRDAAPYFLPAGTALAAPSSPAHTDSSVLGGPPDYYVVTAVNACGQASGISERVGEFAFALTPGQ